MRLPWLLPILPRLPRLDATEPVELEPDLLELDLLELELDDISDADELETRASATGGVRGRLINAKGRGMFSNIRGRRI